MFHLYSVRYGIRLNSPCARKRIHSNVRFFYYTLYMINILDVDCTMRRGDDFDRVLIMHV